MLVPANLNTPGSIVTAGYDKITSITAGESDKQVVVEFSEVYAPYKDLFRNLIKADVTPNCEDVSAEWAQELPFSAMPYKIESWGLDQSVLVPNENYYGENTPTAERIVMVPKADQDTEVASLLSGESDFIFPQAFAGITDALDDPNVSFTPGYGRTTRCCTSSSSRARWPTTTSATAFAKSIDRSLVLANVYDPIFPGAPLLNCGVWVPTVGPWCDQTAFGNEDGTDAYYDPTGAEEILTAAGWEKNADGFGPRTASSRRCAGWSTPVTPAGSRPRRC